MNGKAIPMLISGIMFDKKFKILVDSSATKSFISSSII